VNGKKTGQDAFDAIVIGSGIGGLTTGAILTKLNKSGYYCWRNISRSAV